MANAAGIYFILAIIATKFLMKLTVLATKAYFRSYKKQIEGTLANDQRLAEVVTQLQDEIDMSHDQAAHNRTMERIEETTERALSLDVTGRHAKLTATIAAIKYSVRIIALTVFVAATFYGPRIWWYAAAGSSLALAHLYFRFKGLPKEIKSFKELFNDGKIPKLEFDPQGDKASGPTDSLLDIWAVAFLIIAITIN